MDSASKTLTGQRPVAIIGYAVKLPGAPGRDALWQMLMDGRCAVTQVTPDRFASDPFFHPKAGADNPGRSYTFAAGLIDDVWGFDPAVFGISPREAAQVDPQQRHLLQVAYEALEHAGLRPSDLAGSRTGVYVGASSSDHATRFMFDPGAVDVHMMTGNTLSLISNRLSYCFDLHGPSFTVDTACSSSLVAMHLAMEAISQGKIDTAIVGGVNMLLAPFSFLGFSRASMLSPTGLCKAFDASGDGYVRGEGAVALVLRAEDVACRNGDRIHAVAVGSGINQDGRTTGLSLPSSDAQARLLREVYDTCGIEPDDLAFIEAHGTGTRVGDPAEANALGTTLGQARSAPLPIGSIKTNIGHLEPASGLAGVVKAVMALEHDMLPASLHFNDPNPDIAFDELNIRVAGQAMPLPKQKRPRHAGINSFGFGGSNAHVVLREAPAVPREAVDVASSTPLIVSAHGAAALTALAGRYAAHLDGRDDAEAARVANAAAHSRDLLPERLVVAGPDHAAHLVAQSEDKSGAQAWRGTALGHDLDVAFVFSGNGSQWAGMGLAAYASDAGFRSALTRFDEAFLPLAGWSVVEALHGAELANDIRRASCAQPLLLAIQVATVEALAARGLEPSLAIGHSVGEIAAAWCAGALDLPSAIKVVLARSQRQEVTRHLGSMAAVLVSAGDMQVLLDRGSFEGLEIAAVNSERSITVAGPNAVVDNFIRFAEQERWRVKRLDLDYPFHCALVDAIEQPLLDDLSDLAPNATRIPFISTVSGEEVPGETLNNAYWWRNVREKVDFLGGMNTVCARGTRILVEVGPHQVLSSYLHDALRSHGLQGAVVNTLARDAAAKATDEILATTARVLIAGGRIDLDGFAGRALRPPAVLPHYAFQQRQFVVESTSEALGVFAKAPHPLIGNRLREGSHEWRVSIDPELFPWLNDHRIEDAAVFPAAGFIEMALAVARETFGDGALEVRDLEILQPLVFDGLRASEVTLALSFDTQSLQMFSRPRSSTQEPVLNAKANIAKAPSLPPAADAQVWSGIVRERYEGEDFYVMARRRGYGYGPAFQRIDAIDIADDRTARATLTQGSSRKDSPRKDFILDPTLLDAAFHVLIAMAQSNPLVSADSLLLPIRAGALRAYRPGASATQVIVKITSSSARSQVADFIMLDDAGNVVAELRDARCRIVARNLREAKDDLVYRTSFLRQPYPSQSSALPTACGEGLTSLLAAAHRPDANDAEMKDVALVLAAGARGAAFAPLKDLFAGDEPVVLGDLVANGRLAASAWPLAAQTLLGLSDVGLAQEAEGGWTLAEDPKLPQIADLVDVLTTRYPAWIAEATCIARLPAVLGSKLRDGLDEPGFGAALIDHLDRGSPAVMRLVEIIGDAAQTIIENWPDRQPLRVMIVGASAAPLASRLASAIDARHGALVVTDLRKERLDTLRLSPSQGHSLRMTPWNEAIEQGGYDLVLCAGSLHQVAMAAGKLDMLTGALRPQGALLAAEPCQSLFADLVHGQSPHWWTKSASADFPMSAILADRDWMQVLGDTGLEQAHVKTTGQVVLIDATAGAARHKTANEPPLRSLVIVADRFNRPFAQMLNSAADHDARVVPMQASEARGARRSQIVGISDVDALLRDDTSVTDVVFVPWAEDAIKNPAKTLARQTMDLVSVVKAIGEREKLRLWVLYKGALGGLVDDRAADPVQAGLWASARVLQNEYPQLDIRCVDIEPDMAFEDAANRVVELLAHPGEENELRLDASGICALRIQRGGLLGEDKESDPSEQTMRLEFAQSGVFDSFRWTPSTLPALGPDQIRIKVAAAGLNFRDVMWSLGLLPDEALEQGFTGPAIGMECAGIVDAVGSNCTAFQKGDRVVAFAAQAFASEVVIDAQGAARIPADMTVEAAATLPVAFLTAHYALNHLARLQAGESVLIHGGAGGVGLAAIQIAKAQGATIIATAGTPDRRALLLSLGVDHVFDSRSLSFADDVMRVTQGVDVVLNSLAGEAMARSLDCLKPFGRFLELGKRDFYQNTHLGLRPFRNNLSYFGIDADQLLSANRTLILKLFGELMAMFEAGELSPLPYRAFGAAETSTAFRLMQRSGHIGKILIRPPQQKPVRQTSSALTIAPDGAYLVVGGISGFGLATAQWLASKGARHLHLTSRSGRADEAAAAAIEAMRSEGVMVDVAAVDVTDYVALERYLKKFDGGVPLKGVFHAAMVLDDALARDLDRQRIANVLAPKVTGAVHLDQLTRRFALDHFVLFSSVSAMIGNIGQTNYVAANAFLDGLARSRRAEGLPALAIGFGALGDVGYLARNAAVNLALSQRMGRSALSASEALDGLEALLRRDPHDVAHAAVQFARLDWAMARKELRIVKTPLFDDLQLDDVGSEGGAIAAAQLLSELHDLPAEAVQQRLGDLIADSISRTLRLQASDVDRNRSLSEFGMDSLMMLELRLAVEEQVGIEIPLMSLTASLTVNDISQRLTTLLRDQAKSEMSGAFSLLAQEHIETSHDLTEADIAATAAAVARRAKAVDRIL